MDNYSKKVIKILREKECYFERHGKGDHDIWYSPISKKYFPVDSKIKSRHTANGILKQAGLGKKF
jgi:predicted RNA binding protein YcfA (HicA-like mRNA interferase family)